MVDVACLKVGDTVAYWDDIGHLHEASVLGVAADGAWANLMVKRGGEEVRYVPLRGRRDTERRRCFEVPEMETCDPLAPPPVVTGVNRERIAARMANPLASVEAWMTGAGHGADHWRLYEGLCFEEASEWVSDLNVTDKAGYVEEEALFGRNALRMVLSDLGDTLKKFEDLSLHTSDKNRLVDHHLDKVWVNLCAAAAILGGDHGKLSEAWSRLHKANVDDKQVDGKYVLDSNNKVVKPEGWKAPDYSDLITKEI